MFHLPKGASALNLRADAAVQSFVSDAVFSSNPLRHPRLFCDYCYNNIGCIEPLSGQRCILAPEIHLGAIVASDKPARYQSLSADIRILLADDHVLVRASLRYLLEGFAGLDVVGEASDGLETVKMVGQLGPDVVVMDISMPGLNGLEAARSIAKEHPATRIVMLSMHSDETHVLQALRAGAGAYVLKESAPGELEAAIRAVARGDRFLSPAISRHVIDDYLKRVPPEPGSPDLLTPRQREILRLIAEGKTSKHIARLLGTSVKTVESHRASLMERLDIHDVAGLVRYAIRHGLVSSEI